MIEPAAAAAGISDMETVTSVNQLIDMNKGCDPASQIVLDVLSREDYCAIRKASDHSIDAHDNVQGVSKQCHWCLKPDINAFESLVILEPEPPQWAQLQVLDDDSEESDEVDKVAKVKNAVYKVDMKAKTDGKVEADEKRFDYETIAGVLNPVKPSSIFESALRPENCKTPSVIRNIEVEKVVEKEDEKDEINVTADTALDYKTMMDVLDKHMYRCGSMLPEEKPVKPRLTVKSGLQQKKSKKPNLLRRLLKLFCLKINDSNQ